MKTATDSMKYILIAGGLSFFSLVANAGVADDIRFENTVATPVNNVMKFSADIVMESLKLGTDRQIYLTPVLTDGRGNETRLPSVLINGRAMQIATERGTVKVPSGYTNGIALKVRRDNGKPQTISYRQEVPMQQWMWSSASNVKWVIDTCGCGHLFGGETTEGTSLGLNPASRMRVAYMVPTSTFVPTTLHEGSAQVQYEVGQSELHTEPYVCRDGQPIDNRVELKIIDDSISNALSNKNMEIAGISVTGYASPDGSYLGNERLSTERSRSLANYIADRYNIPAGEWSYSAVAENWAGFRQLVVEDTYLSQGQRDALIALIDRPAYGPSDYDAKENELKTSPEFRKLYSSMILPEWFPTLRTTRFQIQTRLKALSDEELAEVIKTNPETMSLAQMFRVSRLYPEGSADFNKVIDTMLRFYPNDEAANLNAASAALKREDLKQAAEYLRKAGDSLEADNARGILACWNGDLDKAREYFRKASLLPEAAKNLEMLGK